MVDVPKGLDLAPFLGAEMKVTIIEFAGAKHLTMNKGRDIGLGMIK